ncbi:phosphatidate cytidylyltransferase [Syncephalis plumigaleata]|nr:phosphatidate cytidylyltransferase [Syncephalis plumigaleata]
MIGAFFLIMAAGHFWVVSMVIAIQTMVYKEVIFIAHVPSKERKLPWFRSLNWYFLLATNYYFYGESIIYYFRTYMLVDAFLLPLATHHKFISFTIYCLGFVLFVANLKKGHYAFQFTQFAWTHMTLLLVVVQCHFIINNIFEGMFWFFIPVALVITNDIFAYICGFFWGRTPLIKLSPKKTVEGFIGGWVCTMIWGIIFTEVTRRMPYMLCPANGLTSSAWTFNAADCELNPIFEPKILNTGPWLSALLRWLFINVREVPIAPIHWHVLLLSCFASFVAPFGGFFASGLKRAVKIKDFGDSIPGHGGLTDRMDCQFLMGSFAHIYFQSFIKISTMQMGLVLQSIITGLQPKEQLELYNNLRTYLVSQELLDEPTNVATST